MPALDGYKKFERRLRDGNLIPETETTGSRFSERDAACPERDGGRLSVETTRLPSGETRVHDRRSGTTTYIGVDGSQMGDHSTSPHRDIIQSDWSYDTSTIDRTMLEQLRRDYRSREQARIRAYLERSNTRPNEH